VNILNRYLFIQALENKTKLTKAQITKNTHKLEHKQASTYKPWRQEEFLKSRYLLHKYLKHKHSEAIIKDKFGKPTLHNEVKASISHKDGHVVVGVIKNNQGLACGIDLERLGVSNRVLKKICTQEEYELHSKNLQRISNRATLVFSLKESIFKAYFNLHNRAISFLDIKINSLLKNNAQAHLSTSNDQPTLLLKYKNIHLDSMEYVLTTCIIP
jgi:4'-phosphopantetheinyl transferase EntD